MSDVPARIRDALLLRWHWQNRAERYSFNADQKIMRCRLQNKGLLPPDRKLSVEAVEKLWL